LVPNLPSGSLVIAIGIIGATVMPHNLYLHSALVQTREFEQTSAGKRDACKYNLIDSFLALNGAFFINAAILILAGAVFFSQGKVVTEIQQAHELLSPLLGTKMAGILFAVALLASGQSSTITGTLAGQIVMEGFLHLRIRPAFRRIITRSLAIIPAALVISIFGEGSTLSLLILSQVVLSMQLAFAVIPLVHFTSERKLMGEFANKFWVKILAWVTAAIVLVLNINLLVQKETEALTAISSSEQMIGFIALPFLLATGLLLLYVLLKPFFLRETEEIISMPGTTLDGITPSIKYSRVGVAIEGGEKDKRVIEQALSLCADHGSIILIHIISSGSGFFLREKAHDAAARTGEAYLSELKEQLHIYQEKEVHTVIGFGSAPKELIRIGKEKQIDLLVMASHGHRGLKDIIFGTTVSPVRHALNIPVFIVQ
jgi:manganese transport protein